MWNMKVFSPLVRVTQAIIFCSQNDVFEYLFDDLRVQEYSIRVLRDNSVPLAQRKLILVSTKLQGGIIMLYLYQFSTFTSPKCSHYLIP